MLADVYALDTYSGSTENLAGVGTDIEDDDIFAEGDWKLQVPTISGDVDSGYIGALTVSIDTTTEPSSGDMGGRGGEMPEGGEPPSDGEMPEGGEPPSDAPTS